MTFPLCFPFHAASLLAFFRVVRVNELVSSSCNDCSRHALDIGEISSADLYKTEGVHSLNKGNNIFLSALGLLCRVKAWETWPWWFLGRVSNKLRLESTQEHYCWVIGVTGNCLQGQGWEWRFPLKLPGRVISCTLCGLRSAFPRVLPSCQTASWEPEPWFNARIGAHPTSRQGGVCEKHLACLFTIKYCPPPHATQMINH